jgi:hypothetical protein
MTTSAIISAYFAKEFLEGRLANLAQQSTVPEIVLVCKQRSVEEEIAICFGADNPQVTLKILRTPGVPTVYEAWNLGIKACTGTFVTNANSDDRLRPRALEEMEKALVRSPRYAVVYGNQEIVERLDGPVINTFEWLEGGFPELMTGCFLGPMPLWRKSLHDKYGYFDESLRVAGDYEFWLRLASAGEKFMHMRAIVGTYLQREDSVEHKQALRAVWETAQVRARYRKEAV